MEKNELRLQYVPVGVEEDAYQKEWDAYLAERSIEQRNRLAEWNMGLVFSVAKTVRKNVFERMEIGDLIGYGMIGLLESIDRYDPSFSVGFASYAVPRIAGSIWRGIEKWVGIPRRLFRKMCQIEMANTVMKQRLQREPDDFEMAYNRILELCPSLEPLITYVKKVPPPQKGELRQLKYQMYGN